MAITELEQPPRAKDMNGSEGSSPTPFRRKTIWLVAVIALLLVTAVMSFAILPRIKAKAAVHGETAEMAVPTVTVIHPEHSAPSKEIVLPANVQAFSSAPIYARTNGYLKRWYVDIGTHVKKGQLLAEIETPEVDQQLQQARAQLATANANLKLSQITSNRFQELLKSDSVSKQETDSAVGAYEANVATVQANEFNVKRLQDLQSFERIYAPFDGVITARNTDIGALIDSGSGGAKTELFRIAQPGVVRAYVNVPQAYSQSAKSGIAADLRLAEFPGQRFQGKLVRTAEAIDPVTRTLLVEVDVPNPTGSLLTGAYAEVHLKIPSASSAYVLPVNTLLFRSDGLRIATVRDGAHAQLVPVTIGRDFGDRVEVVAGLNGDEAVIVNPPDSLSSGARVRVAQSPAVLGG
ncbi:MAG TPA: efflux RND transporter periplasmic adaptor subunit [Terriglobales bacterium]|jgi:RND family efflux transporter MFP subunit|nr:efflux RND transporter periplasmic adaptor subunit [Terriglobales bacterium]